ncbi:MAG: hypothetical protein Terrestrivirus9_53, partial [Terrestrivirus sp.]
CMITNHSGERWKFLSIEIFSKYFNSDKIDFKFISKIINEIRPWDNLFEDRIHRMISENNYWTEKLQETVETEKINIEIIGVNVFGCPKSRDIDVMVVLSSPHQVTQMNPGKTNTKIIEEEVKKVLVECGYNLNRKLDINLCYVQDGNIYCMINGGRETQNIVFQTYHLHKQLYPCIVNKMIEIDPVDKIVATAKFILDYFEVLVGKDIYAQERQNRKDAYTGSWTKITYAIDIMKQSKLILYSESTEWLNAMKSLCMKIVQIILAENNVYEYTKEGLIERFSTLYPDLRNGIEWCLFYGTRGSYNGETIKLLFSEYTKIAEIHEPIELEWKNIEINLTPNQFGSISTDLISEFLKNPLVPTREFEEGFKLISQEGGTNQVTRINHLFLIPCVGIEFLPPQLLDHVYIVPQRSSEWLNLLKEYICGTNLGVKQYNGEDWVKTYYNLIRGNIMEMFGIFHTDLSVFFDKPFHRVTIGLLVEKKEISSRGMAPDLLLVSENDVIPVEIKCLVGRPGNNHDYRRAVHLAKKELTASFNILSIALPNNPRKGIILIINTFVNDFGSDYEFIARATMIDL